VSKRVAISVISFVVRKIAILIDAMIDTVNTGGRFVVTDGGFDQLVEFVESIQMRIAITEVRWIEVRKSARLRIAKAEQERLCVACMEPLGDQEPIRGCHPKCYRATLRSIHAGNCTESERMEDGKLLEKRDAGRKPSNPVSKETAKR
jgi:preprotein translocase subunit YajC